MIIQCSNNLIRTPLKLFEFSLPRKNEALPEQRNVYDANELLLSGSKGDLINRLLNPPQGVGYTSFQKLRQSILHHSPLCNDPQCQNKVADFFHMINHGASKELVSFWTDENDPFPPPPPLPPITNTSPLGREDDIIANHLKLATETHLKERKRNVMAWIDYDYDKNFYVDDSFRYLSMINSTNTSTIES